MSTHTQQDTSRIGSTATVNVDGRVHTGTIYHVRENGWPCVKTPDGTFASGPEETPDDRIAQSVDYLSALEREIANGADIQVLLAEQALRHGWGMGR